VLKRCIERPSPPHPGSHRQVLSSDSASLQIFARRDNFGDGSLISEKQK
jgi:hypothetical protein